MAFERTFSIVKPDGVARNLIGKIVARIEADGLRVAAAKMKHLSRRDAEGFYAVHKGRPFFEELVTSMSSGPVLLMVLEGDGAILKWRDIMGATNPAQAAENTMRKLYGRSIGENTVHGSDAPETARQEIAWFFPESEIYTKN